MGTNFYYIIPVSELKQQKLKEMITSEPNFCDLEEELDNIKYHHNIHLGKRSCGWQFLWDFHKGRFYGSSLQSIREFLENGGGEIRDEYGRKFTVEQFFTEEINDCLYRDEEHDTLESYYHKHPEGNRYGVRPSQEEFISKDKLRFSKNEDFC